MGASFKTLARVQARAERALDELDDVDAASVLEAVLAEKTDDDREDDIKAEDASVED